jgi:hypothetical protein
MSHVFEDVNPKMKIVSVAETCENNILIMTGREMSFGSTCQRRESDFFFSSLVLFFLGLNSIIFSC